MNSGVSFAETTIEQKKGNGSRARFFARHKLTKPTKIMKPNKVCGFLAVVY